MKRDKTTILKLFEACEQLFFEKYLLESLLIGASVPGWRAMYEKMLDDPICRKPIHALFQPAVEQVYDELREEQAVEEFLIALRSPAKPN